MERRRERPLLLIDIAVPRDIDPRCARARGRHALRHRRPAGGRRPQPRARAPASCPRAEAIVEQEIRRFARWLGEADTLPTVGALREHANAIVEQVLAENSSRWESASPRDRERTEAIARAIANRLLHEPTIRLRGLSGARRHATLELVRELFGLHEDERARRARHGGARQQRARGAASPECRRQTTRATHRSRRFIRCRTAAGADAPRHPRQRPRARAGAARRATCSAAPSSSPPRELARGDGRDRRTASRTVAATSRVGCARSSARCSRARSTSPCTPRRTSPRSCLTGSRCSARRRAVRREDVLCGAAALDALAAGLARGHVQPPPRRAASRARARTSRSSRSRATWTRACASFTTGAHGVDAIALARAGLVRLGREDEIGAVLDPSRFVPAPGPGNDRARGTRRRRARAGGRRRDHRRAHAHVPDRRARAIKSTNRF